MIKSKLLILLILISLLMPLASASIPIYPPSANIQQGYQAGTSSCSIGASTITFSFPTDLSTNGEIYAVTTTAIDLRNISYISISWQGVFGSASGRAVFGISNNQMDASFVTNTTKVSSFSTTTTTLDVSNYYGDYYIKFGGYSTIAILWDILKIYTYGVNLYNFSSTYPTPVTNIQQTTATLNGYAEGDGVIHTGFWYGNQTPSQATVDSGHCINTSVGERLSPTSFSKAVTGLTQYELYQVKSWSYNPYSSAFNVSNNISYFIPLPSGPTNFQVSEQRAKSINLSFTPTSVPVTFNSSTIIRYSTTTYPTTITSGTLGANTTESYALISGLDEETTYYFSAFTWINQSDVEQFSTLYSTASGTTEGGIYNIIIRDELETANGNLPINLTQWYGPHRLIVHSSDQVDYVLFENYALASSTLPYDDADIADGNFTIEVNKSITYMEFQWNYTTNRTYRCNRILVPPSGENNITFFIRTDLPVYGEETAFPNFSLIPYTYGFIDETGKFTPPNNAYCKIFVYNSTGTLLIIHSEYLDATRSVYPWLEYNKKYFIGMYCDIMSIERIGVCPTSDVKVQDSIRIPYQVNYTYPFLDLINIDIGWYDDGFYVSYQDTTSSTALMQFYVYYYSNNTYTGFYDSSTFSTGNFTYTTADGCNTSISYVWRLVATLEGTNVDGVAKKYNGTYELESMMPSGNFTITNIATLDGLIQIIFGVSPIYDWDNPTATPMRWTYIVLFIISFISLATFGKLNAFLGMMACGLTIGVGGALIDGISWVLVIAVLLMIIAIIGLIGGVEKR